MSSCTQMPQVHTTHITNFTHYKNYYHLPLHAVWWILEHSSLSVCIYCKCFCLWSSSVGVCMSIWMLVHFLNRLQILLLFFRYNFEIDLTKPSSISCIISLISMMYLWHVLICVCRSLGVYEHMDVDGDDPTERWTDCSVLGKISTTSSELTRRSDQQYCLGFLCTLNLFLCFYAVKLSLKVDA